MTQVAERPDEDFGFPKPVFRALARLRPPGPLFRPGLFRSPVRGPWLTSVLGLVLLVGLPLVTLTGFLSYAAYEPRFADNAFPRDPGLLRFPHFTWPTDPAWLFRLNQGVHVGLGLALVPIVLVKLWSVLPKLFAWPPSRSIAQVLERLSLLMLVGGVLFEMVTGVFNIQYDYIWKFDFYTAHYYGAWVFLVGLVVHICLKLGTMRRSLRGRMRSELKVDRAHTVPEPLPDETGLVSTDPSEPTISRRGVLALAGGSSLAITAVSLGQTLGDDFRPTALLSPRGQDYGDGPNDFQINRTARGAQITPDLTGGDYRLVLMGDTEIVLTLDDLRAMQQHTVRLPIACVEGWSTTRTWTGVRLRDLAALCNAGDVDRATVRSLEKAGAFNQATLSGKQVRHTSSLLALRVGGETLSMDHGFPARIIVPALPGVHCTKWVRRIEFRA
jgi:DMSO/TMAO reductase YedYZ molybdopterin-dependent catalytic subunit